MPARYRISDGEEYIDQATSLNHALAIARDVAHARGHVIRVDDRTPYRGNVSHWIVPARQPEPPPS